MNETPYNTHMEQFFSINDIKPHALSLGFDVLGIVDVDTVRDNAMILEAFVDNHYHATMHWIETTKERRAHPLNLWNDAQSIIMLGVNYAPGENPLDKLRRKTHGNISVYALGEDYHIFIKKNLKRLAGIIHSATKKQVKIFVDTAPIMEKPIAQHAGIGWQGKHTNLVSKEFGSWLFLGAILTEERLTHYSKPETDHCGTCNKCIAICPTDAFPKPYMLDARRCISYLTIEHKGHIDREFRKPIGNRIFGCDDCLAICPWNKFAQKTHHIKLQSNTYTQQPHLRTLAALNETDFKEIFRKSPVKRTGRERFIRNVLIAIGNAQDSALADSALGHIESPSPLIRAMAIWALAQLTDKKEFRALKKRYIGKETDPYITQEWQQGDTAS